MPAAEFDLPAGHLDAPALPVVRFPETGRPEADVLDDVQGRFDEDRFRTAFRRAGLEPIGVHETLGGLAMFGVARKPLLPREE